MVRAGTAPRRPQLGTRTSSAPLVERRRGSGYAAGLQRLPQGYEPGAQAGTGAAEAFQDEDEVAGVVGAMKQYEPFKSPQVRFLRCWLVRDWVLTSWHRSKSLSLR